MASPALRRSEVPRAQAEAWPELGWEQHRWEPSIPPESMSKAVRRRHAGPYLSAVAPFIAERTPEFPADVLAAAEEASAEIARFDAELGAEVAPFAAVLLRSESASSSMIENLSSGAKAIALAELGSTAKRNATEIVGNVAAMRAALELADRLDPDAILAMHGALLGRVNRQSPGGGAWSRCGLADRRLARTRSDFVPPHHDRVPALMDDLVRFMRRTDLPLLAQTAVAHAQFETIHPFPDGNGRTGRALAHAMLRGHGADPQRHRAGLRRAAHQHAKVLQRPHRVSERSPRSHRREIGGGLTHRNGQRSPARHRAAQHQVGVGTQDQGPSWRGCLAVGRPPSCANQSSTPPPSQPSSASHHPMRNEPSRPLSTPACSPNSPGLLATGCGRRARFSTPSTTSHSARAVEEGESLPRRGDAPLVDYGGTSGLGELSAAGAPRLRRFCQVLPGSPTSGAAELASAS